MAGDRDAVPPRRQLPGIPVATGQPAGTAGIHADALARREGMAALERQRHALRPAPDAAKALLPGNPRTGQAPVQSREARPADGAIPPGGNGLTTTGAG